MTGVAQFMVPGRPVPKARPRVLRNGHVYTATSDAENSTALYVRSLRLEPFHGPVKVTMRFFGAHKLADIDNLAKFTLDALVKSGLILDDRCVAGLELARFDADPAEARTEVEVAAVEAKAAA